MKLSNCPHCGSEPAGILEGLIGTSWVSKDEDTGEYDYADETEICWDTSGAEEDEEGRKILICNNRDCGKQYPNLYDGPELYELWKKVTEHPDFIGGVAFEVDDIPEGRKLPDDYRKKWLTDPLSERGNHILDDICVEDTDV